VRVEGPQPIPAAWGVGVRLSNFAFRVSPFLCRI
jgi:hypothetical protein